MKPKHLIAGSIALFAGAALLFLLLDLRVFLYGAGLYVLPLVLVHVLLLTAIVGCWSWLMLWFEDEGARLQRGPGGLTLA